MSGRAHIHHTPRRNIRQIRRDMSTPDEPIQCYSGDRPRQRYPSRLVAEHDLPLSGYMITQCITCQGYHIVEKLGEAYSW